MKLTSICQGISIEVSVGFNDEYRLPTVEVDGILVIYCFSFCLGRICIGDVEIGILYQIDRGIIITINTFRRLNP